ncbi:MAG: hypothetical protein LBL35_03455 [Clostridiales bacterium]|nr:hypothetical protein [Clostridiales bacterium]
MSPIKNENICADFNVSSVCGRFLSHKLPIAVKMTCDSARAAITGVALIKKPTAVHKATATPTQGEINMAIKIGTWLANVNEAGSSHIFIGEKSGMARPIAMSKADAVILRTGECKAS